MLIHHLWMLSGGVRAGPDGRGDGGGQPGRSPGAGGGPAGPGGGRGHHARGGVLLVHGGGVPADSRRGLGHLGLHGRHGEASHVSPGLHGRDRPCRGVAHRVRSPQGTSLERILEVFWEAHDPTSLNRQGPDAGTQYRSAIFYETEAQRAVAEKSKTAAAGKFARPIVTEIVKAGEFYPAENYHQDYYRLNKDRNPVLPGGDRAQVTAPRPQRLTSLMGAFRLWMSSLGAGCLLGRGRNRPGLARPRRRV
jgi:hypothetical protein